MINCFPNSTEIANESFTILNISDIPVVLTVIILLIIVWFKLQIQNKKRNWDEIDEDEVLYDITHQNDILMQPLKIKSSRKTNANNLLTLNKVGLKIGFYVAFMVTFLTLLVIIF